MIDKDLLIAEAPVECMHTRNINHPDCPAGTDTRKRLYITRTEDGKIIAYCHNCGSKGYVGKRGVTNIRYASVGDLLAGSPTAPSIKLGYLPNDTFVLRTSLPAMKYIEEYGISLEYAEKDGWLVQMDNTRSTDKDRLLFPFFDAQMNIVGWQTKAIDPHVKPKCLTHGHVVPHIFNPDDSNHVVIVEDRMSCVKVVEYAEVAGMCLYGNKALSLTEAHKLSMMFDYVTVWFDNDSETVRNNAYETWRALSIVFKEGHTTFQSVEPSELMPKIDPKNLEPDIIRRWLTWPTSP